MNLPNAQEIQVVAEGLHPAWGLVLFLIVAAGIVWAYRWGAPGLASTKRRWLAVLRAASAAVLILLLVRPTVLLTAYEKVRERLVVLFDESSSMQIADQRIDDADRVRAAIALGEADARRGLDQKSVDVEAVPRSELLAAVSRNKEIALWQRLSSVVDLKFYRFARDLSSWIPEDPANPSQGIEFKGDATGLGNALETALSREAGGAVAGFFLVTDGASNVGMSLADAGARLSDSGVPVFAYGVGIEAPRDLILSAIEGPRVAFRGERAEILARIRSSNLAGRAFQIELLADGKVVAQEEVRVEQDGEMSARIGYVPDTQGRTDIVVRAVAMEGEADASNNEAGTSLRVIGDKVRVLYIEGQPRWDFRYLLATLERDRRLDVKAYLFDSDASMKGNPVFLDQLPATQQEWFDYQIIILGDVEPERLGSEPMEWIKDWVDKIGGGLILLAGPRANPRLFARTPLEVLFPVTFLPALSGERAAERYPELRPLRLTPAGEATPDFAASEEAEENRRIWSTFPGVRWTATVGPAKPGALVIAVDPERSKVNREGAMPVVAMQNFGLGVVVYFGFEETYRWRSETGEKHYLGIWGRLIQSLSLRRLEGASRLVQLRASRPRLAVGETLTIEGTLYKPNYQPLTDPTVIATIQSSAEGSPPESATLTALAERPGEYRLDYRPTAPGTYRLVTSRDPEASIEFEVIEPRLEAVETAMAANALKALAGQTGGLFLREESLAEFPDVLSERSSTVPLHSSWKLYLSPWWLLLILALLSTEWALRRLWQLK